jgi:SAM-dependent methyltransferase
VTRTSADSVSRFSRDAVPSSLLKGRSDEESLSLLVDVIGAGPEDRALDVACGPGQVVFAFASVVRQATGIDIDLAMIERARQIQAEKNVSNAAWRVGDGHTLPFEDASFSIVTCRYAIHHFIKPGRVIEEMTRVCTPNGRLALVDIITTPDKATVFNDMERLLEPSTVRVLTHEEFGQLAIGAGLRNLRQRFYLMEMELETLFSESLPKPEDVPRVRQILMDDLDRNALGINVHRKGNEIHVAYPVTIIVGTKPV